MMPCATGSVDSRDGSKELLSRRTIYKPKYHAFSIDSLVGKRDTDSDTTQDTAPANPTDPTKPALNQTARIEKPVIDADEEIEEDIDDDDDEEEEYDNYSETSLKSRPSADDRPDPTRPQLTRNDILRSYMTTASAQHYLTSHHHYQRHSGPVSAVAAHHYPDPHAHHLHHHLHHQTPHHLLAHSRYGAEVIRARGLASDAGIGSSVVNRSAAQEFVGLNPNQHYCGAGQQWCRLYESGFPSSVCQNAFMPSVCDYESLLTKSVAHHRDLCSASSSPFSPYRKPKRVRTAFSPGQLLRLEEIFERNRYVVGCERKQLARDLNLSETQIKVWFQNRRTKHKREKHQESGGGQRRGSTMSMQSLSPSVSGGSIMASISGESRGNNRLDFMYSTKI